MEIIASAQEFMRRQGIDQWQNGYPGLKRIEEDVEDGIGYVVCQNGAVAVYAAITFGDEPSYQVIYSGSWAAKDEPYATIHRLACLPQVKGTGLSSVLVREAEALCAQHDVVWMRADTHRDNYPMRGYLEKNGFEKRGIIYIAQEHVGGAPGDERLAYERML